MQKALTIGVAAAAIVAALSFHAAGGAGAETAAAGKGRLTLHYVRGPRIIHVPQPGEWQEDAPDNTFERDQIPARGNRHVVRGSSNANDHANDDSKDDVAPPAPRRRAATSTHRSPPKPRRERKPYSASPPLPSPPPPAPLGPPRAVLSAPPPRAEGMSPIYPTPRFEAKAEPAEKFTSPSDPLSTASVPPGDAPPPAPHDTSRIRADQ